MKKRKKLGLALGAGGARGLAHIGILKILEKHGIQVDYIAGTSMGAVIGAFYGAGHSPEDLEQIAKTTDWRNIVDFNIPKVGLVTGQLIERKIDKLVYGKNFKDLRFPLRVVSYNLTKREQVIFSKGNISTAVRASLSIPAIFSPLKIGQSFFVDGAVGDPTPFDVVKEMGADVILAVDLFVKEKTVKAPRVKKSSLMTYWKEMFVVQELYQLKNLIFPEEWPKFIRRLLMWTFDKLLYPARVLRILAGREIPPITRTIHQTIQVLTNNLAKERLKNADIDVLVTPSFGNLDWYDFDKVEEFISIGEKSMRKKIELLKKKLA
ncbi:MAG: hypothetical protein CMH61_02735 [Nanoarchaeota archaeon]|nr:hypothetical protein [Nanoarchaeota archaeon]|tara:strand:- start:706 stop:1671 length:966 start_codon:yes stop_codon:yes gene_type:complete